MGVCISIHGATGGQDFTEEIGGTNVGDTEAGGTDIGGTDIGEIVRFGAMRIQKQKWMERMKRALLLVLFPTLFLIAVGDVPAISDTPPLSVQPVGFYHQSGRMLALDMYYLTREENPRLRWNSCLAHVAYIRARRIVETGYFCHKDPVTGINPAWGMIRNECFQFRWAGENFVKGSYSPAVLNRALMNSPPHRENILDPDYQMVGIGCCRDVCVQEFAGFGGSER
jgi:hypothetical protein